MNIWFFRTLGGFKPLGVLARGLQETGARPMGSPASATRGGDSAPPSTSTGFYFLSDLLRVTSLPSIIGVKSSLLALSQRHGVPLEGYDPESDSECRTPGHTEHPLYLRCPQQPHAGEPHPAHLQAPSAANDTAVNILIHLLAHLHK